MIERYKIKYLKIRTCLRDSPQLGEYWAFIIIFFCQCLWPETELSGQTRFNARSTSGIASSEGYKNMG